MLKATHDFQKEILSCGVIRGLKYDLDTMTFVIPLKLNYLQKKVIIEMHEKVLVKLFDCGKEMWYGTLLVPNLENKVDLKRRGII